jgi:peptidoglycan/LPS O-acetylase OafA/YrhL
VNWWPSFLQPVSKTGLFRCRRFLYSKWGRHCKIGSELRKPFKFAKARFLRLFPVYFLATLLAICVAPMAARVVSRKEALFSLSGLQFWTGGSTLVGAAWTIPYEVGFYFLVFLALQYFDKEKSKFDEKRLLIFLNCWLLLIVIAPALNIQVISFLCIENYGS